MTERVRIPHGMAKRIVATMSIGDRYVARPEHVMALQNAARRLGVRVWIVRFRRGRAMRFWVLRIADGWGRGKAAA